jgi:hypothetical protein
MKVTREDVLKWNNTIAKWKHEKDVHYALLCHLIAHLEKKIAFAVKDIINHVNGLTKKYFFLENGDVKYMSDEPNAKPVMKHGMKYEDYIAEKEKFLKTEIEIKL